MSFSAEHTHPVVDVVRAGEIIQQLHDQVCGGRQRVHLSRSDCDDVCVMVSRSELEALERAVSIFADTKEFNDMCQTLSKLLESAGVVYPSQSSSEEVA